MDEKIGPKEKLTAIVLAATAAYGGEKSSDFIIKTRKREYHISSVLGEGDLSTIYKGYFDESEKRNDVIIKIVKGIEDNELVKNEIRIIRTLFAKEDPNQIHLPVLIDQFKTKEQNMGIVLKEFEGINVNELRKTEKWIEGVDPFHGAWMMSRLLAVTGYAHKMGIIHCNIEPNHVMIGRGHNVGLLDWSYATQNKEIPKKVNPLFWAPEIQVGTAPMTSSDLYSIGRCMVHLLGGNLEDNSMPESVDIRFQRFIENLLMESPYQRPRDAWEILQDLSKLRTEIWGKIEFVPFEY